MILYFEVNVSSIQSIKDIILLKGFNFTSVKTLFNPRCANQRIRPIGTRTQ